MGSGLSSVESQQNSRFIRSDSPSHVSSETVKVADHVTDWLEQQAKGRICESKQFFQKIVNTREPVSTGRSGRRTHGTFDLPIGSSEAF